MHCLISVVLRDWGAVHDEAQRYKRSILGASSGSGLERPPIFAASKGFLLLVDWDEQRILGGLELDKPMGFLIEGDRIHVALWDLDAVVTLSCGGPQPRMETRCRHRWFNHIHTLDETPRGLLVSSAGSDLLAETNEKGELLWSFFMFEHGYGGRRYGLGGAFDPACDYNRRYLPAALTAHPNSAILLDDDSVLATLFSTGELVKIDRGRSAVEVVLEGMSRPHAIRRRAEGGYMFCDSEGGRVILLDRALRFDDQVEVASPWIQDAVFAGDRLFVASNRRIVMHPLNVSNTAVTGDNAVIELRGRATHQKLSFGPDSRVYAIEPLTSAAADGIAPSFLASAFDWSRIHWDRS